MSVVNAVQALKRRSMILIDDGRHIAGLVYVGNVVDALILAADTEVAVGQAYNISDETGFTWREYLCALADLIEVPHPQRSRSHRAAYAMATLWEGYYRLLGRTQRPPMTRMMVEHMGTDQELCIDKAKDQLGYRPRVSFEEGLRHTGDGLRQAGLLV